MSPDEQLIQNVVGLVEVEYDVQLTYISEVSVQHFHEEVDLFQHYQLVVTLIHACDEEQRRIALVDHLHTYIHTFIHKYNICIQYKLYRHVALHKVIQFYKTDHQLILTYIHTYIHTYIFTTAKYETATLIHIMKQDSNYVDNVQT